jgi:hypothetical protein
MQENLDLPAGERKESMMIRVLAQIISHQVCPLKEGIREEPDPPPPLCQHVEQTPSVSGASSSVDASSPDMATLAAGNWPEPSAQALVVLFTELAQRRVQAARAQEETHEYYFHHHSPSRTHGLRLRAPIDAVASQ